MFFNLISLIVFSFLFEYADVNVINYFSLLFSLVHLVVNYRILSKKIEYFIINPLFINLFFSFIYLWFGVISINIFSGLFTRFSSVLNVVFISKALFLTNIAISSQFIGYFLINLFLAKKNFSITLPKLHVNKWGAFLIITVVVVIENIFSLLGYTGYYATIQNIPFFSTFNVVLIKVGYLFLIFLVLNSKFKFFVIPALLLSTLGLVSGSKTLIILPFIYLLILNYLKSHKLNYSYILNIVILLIISFTIITPIRYILKERKQGYSLNRNTYKEANKILSGNSDLELPINALITRINQVPQLTTAIVYDGPLPESVDELWIYTIKSPLYAFLPSTILKERPKVSFGSWFSVAGFNSTEESNVGATFQGILYMNNGIFSVIFGFLLVGIVQGILIYILIPKHFFLYLVLIQTIAFLPQEPWLYFVSILQYPVLMFVIYKIIIKLKLIRIMKEDV